MKSSLKKHFGVKALLAGWYLERISEVNIVWNNIMHQW